MREHRGERKKEGKEDRRARGATDMEGKGQQKDLLTMPTLEQDASATVSYIAHAEANDSHSNYRTDEQDRRLRVRSNRETG